MSWASLRLAVGYALVTVLLLTLGLLSSFTGVILHTLRGSFVDLERRLLAGYRTAPGGARDG